MNAQLPAIQLLLLISVLSRGAVHRQHPPARLGAAGRRDRPVGAGGARGRRRLPGVRPALPGVAGRSRPRETPYISRNIEATRAALGLDEVVDKNFDYDAVADRRGDRGQRGQPCATSACSTPPWSSAPSSSIETQLELLPVHRHRRRPLPDRSRRARQTQVVIATRELNPTGDPRAEDAGRREHLVYTHGYGLALAPANTVTTPGAARLPDRQRADRDRSVGRIRRADRPARDLLRRPARRGRRLGYAIVGDRPDEERVGPGRPPRTRARAACRSTGFVRRRPRSPALRRPRDADLGLPDRRVAGSSTSATSANRVEEVAPFLTLDDDPYPVLVDGRIKYVIDAYTTVVDLPLRPGGGHDRSSRPARRSGPASSTTCATRVKAVVDAYDGTVDLYLADDAVRQKDPDRPGLRQGLPRTCSSRRRRSPTTIRDHLRYPEDMFRIQTAMWGRYHIDDAEEFYDQSDRWDVAQDPGSWRSAPTAGDGALGEPQQRDRIAPYYLLMNLPDEQGEKFLLFRPFVPYSNNDSQAAAGRRSWSARSDPDDYGKLQAYTMTQVDADGKRDRNRDVDGPADRATTTCCPTRSSHLSQTISLLQGGGSTVRSRQPADRAHRHGLCSTCARSTCAPTRRTRCPSCARWRSRSATGGRRRHAGRRRSDDLPARRHRHGGRRPATDVPIPATARPRRRRHRPTPAS